MNFLMKALTKVIGLFIDTSSNQINSNVNTNVNRTENTNAIAIATAFLLWSCGAILTIFWAFQYGFATYFWIKTCLHQNMLVDFPLSSQKLLDLIYSLIGVSVAGGIHKVTNRFLRKL